MIEVRKELYEMCDESTTGEMDYIKIMHFISMIPVVIMYAIFQKPLQNGLSASDGVKG